MVGISAEDAAESPQARRSVVVIALYAAIIVFAWAALELWGLGKAPFHTKGEPREGLVVWEMLHDGGWILPRRNGVELPSKPPLFHWLGAVVSLAHGGADEWSIRFPSAGLSLVALLCVFASGVALWTPRAGLLSALVLMTTFEWARAATGARVDMTLTFGLQLAFLSLLFFLRTRRTVWLPALYAGITLAVLGKGPVGAVLPGLVALLMLALTRDGSFLRQMRLGYGALVVSIGAGTWYVLALLLGGYEFFRKQILVENLFTFLDSDEFKSGGHHHPAPYLLGALALGVLPWTLFVPGMVARLWRQRRTLSSRDPRTYLLIWIAVVFGFYALAASKRGVYLLALYPALALLLGWWWDEQGHAPAVTDPAAPGERWPARLPAALLWVLMVIVGLTLLATVLEALGAPLAALVQRWLPADAQAYAAWTSAAIRTARWPLLGLLLAALAALYATTWALRGARWMDAFAGVFATIAALVIAANQVIVPRIAVHESFRDLMSEVRQLLGPEGNLSFFKTFEYGAVFYWRGHIPVYEGSWPAGAPRYLLMDREEWERMKASATNQYEQVTFSDEQGLANQSRLVLIRRIAE